MKRHAISVNSIFREFGARLRRPGIVLFAMQIFLPNAALAFQSKSGELLLSAQEGKIITENNQAQIIHLKGNVQILFRGQHLKADEAHINQKSKEVEAIGNVVFTTPTATLEGDRFTLDADKNTGVVYNGFLQMGQVQFEGALIKKIGPEEYEAIDGNYTACVTCPPGWSFQGTRITAEVGGYSYIRNPILKIARVPIFWLPYLIVPLKSERQSGLLFPSFEFSESSGFAYSESFFWAINKSQDATFTLKNYKKRGWKVLSEYRYVLTPESSGKMNLAYMKDKSLTDQNNGSSFDRYYLQYDHRYHLPDGFVHRLDMNLPSDIRYPRDFSTEAYGDGDSALENKTSLTKNSDATHTSIEADYYINLLKPGYISNNLDTVHRFPEVRYSVAPIPTGLGGSLFSFNANYLSLTRNTFGYDKHGNNRYAPPVGDPTLKGPFNPDSDQYRTGQRTLLTPKISYPINLGKKFDLLPAVSFNDAEYAFQSTDSSLSTSNQPSAQRRYVRTEASLRTRFDRVYGDKDNEKARRFRHEIQPEITYSAIPWYNGTNHPFFGTATSDPFFKANQPISDTDNLQFDYNDRLIEQNLLTFSLTNKLIRRRWWNKQPDYKQIVLFKLSQSFDIYENSKTNIPTKQPYSEISALLDVRLDRFEMNSITKYYPYQNFASTASRARTTDARGDFAELNYTQSFTITGANQIDLSTRSESLRGDLGLKIPYAYLTGGASYNFVTYRVDSWNAGINLQPPGNCWYMSLTYTKDTALSGGNIQYNFAFLFDGKNATGVSPASLKH